MRSSSVNIGNGLKHTNGTSQSKVVIEDDSHSGEVFHRRTSQLSDPYTNGHSNNFKLQNLKTHENGHQDIEYDDGDEYSDASDKDENETELEPIEVNRGLSPTPVKTPQNADKPDDDQNDIYFDANDKELTEEETLSYSMDDPLLESQSTPQRNTWWNWTKQKATNFSKVVASVISAGGPAINSFLSISGQTGIEVAKMGAIIWWNSLGVWSKVFSIIFALCSLDVNAKLNWDFFSEFWQRLTDSIKNARKDPKEAINAIFSLIIGGIGGPIGMAAIAYEGFIFLPYAVFIFTAATFATFMVSRYLGINKFISRALLKNAISELQTDLVDKLDHLKPEHKTTLQEELKNLTHDLLDIHERNDDWMKTGEAQLDNNDFEKIFVGLGKKLSEIANAHPDCFEDKTCCEQFAHYCLLLTQLLLSGYVFATSLGIFDQKGFAGVNAAVSSAAPQTGTDLINSPTSAKVTIGLIAGGLGSTSLYTLSAFDHIPLWLDSGKYLMKNPCSALRFSKELIVNGIAATSMWKVGADVAKHNILNINETLFTHFVMAAGGGVGGFVVNYNSILKQFHLTPDLKAPVVDEIADHFRRLSIRIISNDSAAALQQHSLFKPAEKESPIKTYSPVRPGI